MAFTVEELLSMGQSRLVHKLRRQCDQRIYLSTTKVKSNHGTSVRKLALYDVLKNELGFSVKWPGKEQPRQNQHPMRGLLR